MASVGDLVVQLRADSSQLTREMRNVTGPRGPLGALPGIAAGAVAAAGAAFATLGAKGATEFAKLEQSMNEVFTLMPGITDTNMGAMTDDVQAFADEFGVVTADVVPALYDAISAGVPPDNVFDFLETANKTAIGGVSDLNTAVDGLTSATNAYGEDVLSFDKASDSMFTAVRLGKTTIDELSAAVSDTAPIAADLGVSFDEVNASLAAMTAQGEPTSKASTKLRQALAELSKNGSTAFAEFEKASGQTFPDFIEGGGTLQDALTTLADHAEGKGKRVGDMFGSIEAAQATQMLVSDKGRETMIENLDAMSSKAGATEAAYDQMDQGMSRSWDKMKANVETFMQEFGERLAPVLGPLLDDAIDLFNDFETAFFGVFDAVTNLFQTDLTEMDGLAGDAFSAIGDNLQSLQEVGEAVFSALAAVWDTILKPAWDAMAPLVRTNFAAIELVASSTLDILTGLFNAFADLLEGDFTGAWNHIETMIGNVLGNLEEFIGTWTANATEVFDTFRTAVTGSMERLFGGFGALAQGGFEGIAEGFNWLKGQAETIMEALGSSLASIAGGIGELVRNAFGNVVQWMTDQVNGLIDAVNGFIDRLNSALEIDIPSVSATIPDWVPGVGGRGFTLDFPSIDPPNIPPIPHLAEGGIVNSATVALIGEAGPEAVVPLDRMGGMSGGGQTIIVELDGRTLMRSVAPRFVDELRLKTGLAGM